MNVDDVIQALEVIEGKLNKAQKADLQVIEEELRAIRHWSNNLYPKLAVLGNKLLELEREVERGMKDEKVGSESSRL